MGNFPIPIAEHSGHCPFDGPADLHNQMKPDLPDLQSCLTGCSKNIVEVKNYFLTFDFEESPRFLPDTFSSLGKTN